MHLSHLVASCGMLMILWGCAAAQTPASAPATVVTIDPKNVAVESFMGFGGEWDPQFWAPFNQKLGATEADWDRVTRRLAWLRVPIVRMMIQTYWCYRGEGKFDWDNPEMKGLYRHLDVCQKQGIAVFLTDWGVYDDTKTTGITGPDDPKYAKAIGAYLDHLINVKGYTCIKYFIMGNEPNWGRDFDAWAKGVRNLAKVIAEHKLNVTMVGTDTTDDPDWHRKGVDQLADIFGMWDIHRYAPQAQVRWGQLERYFKDEWGYARSKDPGIARKRFIVAEAGMGDGMVGAGACTYIDSFEYGLFMADYAVQATRAGTSAVMAWMIDDSSHEGFSWGLWKNKAGGFALRPWFYTWSLLCRHVPAGSTLMKVDSSSDSLRIMAARTPGNAPEGGGWTFVLVNRYRHDTDLTLRVSGGEKLGMDRYLYKTNSMAADADGFPRPLEQVKADLDAGLPVRVPACSVVVLTTVKDSVTRRQDNSIKEPAPTGSLTANTSPAQAGVEKPRQWTLAYTAAFSDEDLARSWEVKEGEARISGKELVVKSDRNGFVILKHPTFNSSSVKVELIGYLAKNEKVSDISVLLNSSGNSVTDGCLFQFGTAYNTENRLQKNNEIIAPTVSSAVLIEPGKKYKVVAENDNGRTKLTVDGQTLFDFKGVSPLTGDRHGHIGLYTWASEMRIESLKVYQK